ncbi:17524_t:CDS:10 [Cetraspora pellucida]|uniref:17524_t:CDS:1 n=1 Tax=Cetraspora pellucida TaxID=1433469 RepID=A0A9N9C9Q4_9GLOM|nr:17524_t:CDS:10 [Cetraspora pellucida]
MVSYEPKKNGRQEGSYRGETTIFENYAAYRAPPTTKPRRVKSSDEETVKLFENGCQSQYPLSSTVSNPVTFGQRNSLSRVNSLDQNPRLAYLQRIPKSQPDTAYRQTVAIYQTEFLYPDPQQSYVHRKTSTSRRSMTINGTTSIHFYSDSEDVREGSRSKNYRNHRSSTLSSGSEISSAPSSPSKVVKQQFSVVNPALLSRVSESFRARITLSNRMKDNLEYKDCFDGREAVLITLISISKDKIAFIIKTTDRNLALLLGRALDAQKFFHDVTYDHRLRDSQNELYQFRKMPSILSSSDNYGFKKNDNDDSEETDLPTGVFTLLTDCYSPTCTRDNLCYSIACPRRLEQHARKHMRPNPDLSRSTSRGSIADRRKDQKLWIHTVPPEIANSVSEAEKKRQEAINELIYTEKDFVHDLVYLRDCWMIPLLSQNIIPEFRREKFVADVFHNIMDIYSINSKLGDALQKRQNSYAIVRQIGDILLEYVPKFSPFIEYGAHQLWGKYYFENEKNTNPAFAEFVEDTERLPKSRKLELNGYLTKPTTRLGRYPLLLEAILRQTPQSHPDKTSLPKVISLIKECLSNVNTESGKSENRFNLQQLNDQLISNGSEDFDLKLTEEGRQLIFKGSLKRSNESSDLQVFLFDHALLMVKVKIINKVEQYKIYRRPIPIELLKVSTEESDSESNRCNSKRTQSILPGKSPTTNRGSSNNRYPITISCLGKKGFTENLYALTMVSRKRWIDLIAKQKEVVDKNKSFEKPILIEKGQFTGANKINCAAFYERHPNLECIVELSKKML